MIIYVHVNVHILLVLLAALRIWPSNPSLEGGIAQRRWQFHHMSTLCWLIWKHLWGKPPYLKTKSIHWHDFRYRKVLLIKIADIFMSISMSPFRLRIQNPGQALSLKRKVCIGHDARLLKWSNPAGPKFRRLLNSNSMFFKSCQTAICWQRERACWPVIFASFAHIFKETLSGYPPVQNGYSK